VVTLNAVHEIDLEGLLRSLKLDTDLRDGILGCEFCEEPVTAATIYALYAHDTYVKIVCRTPSCVRAFLASNAYLGLPEPPSKSEAD